MPARRDGVTISKPTYYLWRGDFPSQKEYQTAKECLTDMGFRVVTYREGQQAADLHAGFRALLQNHWAEGPRNP
ncbi:MAG: hypothetical protein HFI42_02625 [Lachnospiraceae bacterium]|nr:hypothetical protein [Lachnospiraceae bacterium]MCI9149380.1 hypothetical protein [Lachnospiraceae bacterium]